MKLYVPEDSFIPLVGICVTLAIAFLICFKISNLYFEAIQKKEQRKWKKFKKDTRCVLIGIDKSGFFSNKYIWKTKDGIIVKNKHKN